MSNCPLDSDHPRVVRQRLADVTDDMASGWWELLLQSGAELFLSPDWVICTASAMGLEGSVEVLAERDRGHLRWVCPLLRQRRDLYGLKCTVFEAPGDLLVAYHGDLLSYAPRAESLQTLVSSLGTVADLIIFPAVVASSPLERAVLEFAAASGWQTVVYESEASPYLPIDCSWDEFLASKSSNFRYSIRRKQRALQKLGRFEERWFTAIEDVEPLMNAILHIESASWKAEADMAISGRSVEQEYYGKLLPFLAERGALAANGLFLDDEPIAYSLCYTWAGKYGQLKTSFSEAYSNQSPGLVVNNGAIRRAFEEGCREFDFLGAIMPHKMHWTEHTRSHKHYYLFAPKLRMRALRAAKSFAQLIRKGSDPRRAAGRGARKSEKKV